MKKLKRICACLLSASLMLSCVSSLNPLAAENNISEPVYVSEVVGMNLLDGIEYESTDEDMKVSDFKSAMKEGVRYDISFMLNGITVGEYIRYCEAVKVFVDVLGYGQMHSYVYPSEYMEKAQQIGLLNGIQLNGAQVLTYKDFCHLFYNALDIKVIEQTGSTGGKPDYRIGEKFKTVIVGIEKIRGQITANSFTAIDGTMAYKNHIRIGNEQYIIPQRLSEWNKRVGYYVIAYYREKEDNEKELAYIEFDSSSTAVRIDAADMVSYEDYTVTYQKSPGIEKKQQIPKNVAVIYNGKNTTQYNSDMFMPENGSVTLISAPGSSTVGAVSITSYQDCYISGIDGTNYFVYNDLAEPGAENKKFSFNENDNPDTTFFYNENGDRMSFADIKTGDVLSIAQNGEYSEVYVSTKKIKGIEVSSQFEDVNGRMCITVKSGETYVLSRAFINSVNYESFSLNKSYDIALNVFGQIVKADVHKLTDMITGFFVKSYHDENEETTSIKMFLKEGLFAKYDIAENVTVTDAYGKKHRIKSDGSKVLDIIKNYEGLMWVALNEENKINRIDLGLKKYSDEYPESAYLITPEANAGDKYTYKYEYRTWGYHYFMTSATTVWSVPDAENRDDEELYRLVNLASLDYDNNITDAEFIYSTDPDGIMISDIVRTTKKRSIDIREDLIVVTSVTSAVTDDGTVCKRIVGMVDGNKVVYDSPIESDGKSAFDRATDLAHEGEENPPVYEVRKGDFIRVGYEYYSNHVFAVQLVYRSTIENPMFPVGRKGFIVGSAYLKDELNESIINPIGLDYEHKHAPMTSSINAAAYRVYLGWVYKKNGSIITLTTQDLSCSVPDLTNPEYFTESYNINSFGRYTTVDYDEIKNPARQGNIDDVRAYKDCGDSCSRVLVTRYWGELNQIIVINGEDRKGE